MTQTGTTFTKELIESLPLQRDLISIYNSAPGMFSRTSHGSDARSNNFIVDGVKMQDPVTGDPYGQVTTKSSAPTPSPATRSRSTR